MLASRTIGASMLIGVALLSLPALAQTAPAAPDTDNPKPASDPAFDAAKAAAVAMGADAFASIQQDLIWTGDLNTLPSGEMGKRSYDAIRAFQKRIGVKDTGIFTPQQRDVLAQHAAKFTTAFGFDTLTEHGITIGYPAKVTTERSEGRNGPHFSTPKAAKNQATVDILNLPTAKESFEALFARLKTENPKRKVTYSLLRPDFFVVSGTNEGMTFYIRFIRTDAESRGFVLGWDPALSPRFDRVAIAMASSLKLADAGGQSATPKPAPPPEPPEPPKPVGPPVPLAASAPTTPKTGIGTFVSSEGDILTYAGVIAGCETVTLQGGGKAKVIGGDPNNDIALVRGALPAGAQPLAWRLPALGENEAVSLLSGAAPVATTVSALAGANGDTRRVTLAAGTAGALIDKDGALAGLPAADGSPSALKGLFVTAFLRANGATPPSQGGDPTKASAVLTCDPRKP
ncbi:peptidoglycan-binding protein [Labrys miyagiensis]|uniref:Peptidoglycan-binding protein n=1 Tax=Labrys miyagiensis TaxID=346912 RepID=A0ABQ6CYE2_9HYPH|nr:peptidoglycan-binding protein [Labrys miyagiensis]GLS23292.1 peptidoglycan-binding protein [Labrys miyagiensis]